MEVEKHEQREPTGCNFGGVITFGVGLVAGTFSAVVCKMLYETSSTGLDGTSKLFGKPIMVLLLMFMSMVPAIFFYMAQQAFLEKKNRDVISSKTLIVLMIPSICDLLCTLLLLVAQLYITASMWQMLRGSVIIITALLKRYVLDHRLRAHMWAGIGTIFIAMVLVASTTFFAPAAPATEGSSSGKDPRIGVVLVILGCIAQGVQYVFEEKVMAVDNAPPLVVIGMEGLWGTFLTLTLVYPAAYMIPGPDNGSFESFSDSLLMIQSNPQLQNLVLLFVITVTIYNCMAVYVTKYLSAIWHAILDNFRPITIWVLDLYIYYSLYPGTAFGEKWVNPGSYIQLGGLLVLFLGTAVYNGSIATCDNGYESIDAGPDEKEDRSGKGYIKTPMTMASPSLTRSPMIYAQARKAEQIAAAAELSKSSCRGHNHGHSHA
mmetsp:Transcript_2960/g.3101  ORF Transcript_2960/g.3101 Transcript_2960/m.3101 type:complete len:432 (+) Transcript_2960:153-1448(+)|eukprot:CAMPEP_0119045188 /NCGR_PEP_ID=MMETSP1177-20130426/37836_1 /TAXON_ID=2985 /ORGANISM="Ochromonas sp, Strain CCMP1899" /LENGTH=431 /DNA_ID=CAMNT_0007016529 /DNA_START=68 /DNA_END=1363 /DNA_ORIENTATION=-